MCRQGMVAGLSLKRLLGGVMMKSIKIKGMSCQHCVMAVMRALNAVEGLTDVRVDLTSGVATYRETKPVSEEKIATAIREAGYDIAE